MFQRFSAVPTRFLPSALVGGSSSRPPEQHLQTRIHPVQFPWQPLHRAALPPHSRPFRAQPCAASMKDSSVYLEVPSRHPSPPADDTFPLECSSSLLLLAVSSVRLRRHRRHRAEPACVAAHAFRKPREVTVR